MITPTLSKIGAYLGDLCKLLLDLAQLALTVAAFGYAALKTQNALVDSFAIVLEGVGSIYLALNFAIKTSNFAFDISQISENLAFKFILLASSGAFVYCITKFITGISTSLINAIVVTLG